MTQDGPSEPRETDRERRLGNLVLLLVFVLLVGAGIWIANVMLDVRKTQDCVASGRRNCAPIDAPVNPR